MEQFNANPIRSGVGLTVTPPQTASRSITPTESHKPDPQNLIYVPSTTRLINRACAYRFLHPQTFSDPTSIVSALGDAKNLGTIRSPHRGFCVYLISYLPISRNT